MAAFAAGEPPSRWAGTRAVELALLVALPLGGALHLAASGAVSLLFGPAFADAAPVAGWLAWAFPALAVNLLGAYLLGAAHRMGPVAALYGGTLVVKTALDAVLIPRLGPAGAAAAMVLAETALAAGILLVLRREAGVAPSFRALAAAAGAAALIPVAGLIHDTTGGFVAAGAYLVAVGALYALGDVVHPSERRVLGRVLRERRVAAEAS